MCRCYWLHITLISSTFPFFFFFPFASLLQINWKRCSKTSNKYMQLPLRFTYLIPECILNESVADFTIVKHTTSEDIWKHNLLFGFILNWSNCVVIVPIPVWILRWLCRNCMIAFMATHCANICAEMLMLKDSI